jgi:hypothetical protein
MNAQMLIRKLKFEINLSGIVMDAGARAEAAGLYIFSQAQARASRHRQLDVDPDRSAPPASS